MLSTKVGYGALAQLGERLLCKHQVIGSIPIGSTILPCRLRRDADGYAAGAALSNFSRDEDTFLAGAIWPNMRDLPASLTL
jgi:hypothetical protein